MITVIGLCGAEVSIKKVPQRSEFVIQPSHPIWLAGQDSRHQAFPIWAITVTISSVSQKSPLFLGQSSAITPVMVLALSGPFRTMLSGNDLNSKRIPAGRRTTGNSQVGGDSVGGMAADSRLRLSPSYPRFWGGSVAPAACRIAALNSSAVRTSLRHVSHSSR